MNTIEFLCKIIDQKDVVNYINKTYNINIWNYGLEVACSHDDKEKVEIIINNGATDFNTCLGMSNSKEINELLLKHGADDLKGGFCNACCNGYKEIASLMIEYGADNCWNKALERVCESRTVREEIIEWLRSKGANNFNNILTLSCVCNNVTVAKMMIKYGATSINEGLEDACRFGNIELIELMLSYKPTNIKECLQKAQKYKWVGAINILDKQT